MTEKMSPEAMRLHLCLDRHPVSPGSTCTVAQADLRALLQAHDELTRAYDERGRVLADLAGRGTAAVPWLGGPCSTCRHRRDDVTTEWSWCALITVANGVDRDVLCVSLGGGCRAWEAREEA